MHQYLSSIIIIRDPFAIIQQIRIYEIHATDISHACRFTMMVYEENFKQKFSL